MNAMEPLTVLTVGHSTHEYESFLILLRRAEVNAIADVRTSPFSRHLPHFNCDTLRENLRRNKISYVFLGKELGGRPSDHKYYSDGVADYEKMATSDEFKKGLNRVIDGAKKYRIALMCSEHNPLDCHRCLLVGPALSNLGITVKHVLSDGRIATHLEIEEQLLELSNCEADDLFASRDERLSVAYRDRARKVAFAEPQPNPQGAVVSEWAESANWQK